MSEILRWSAPALLVGLVLRIVLTVHMPYGYFHDDAPDFLTTPDRLLFDHALELHSKKTFLVPFLFTVPFLAGIPALLLIPAAQHLLGLAGVALVGALTRLWFARWRLFILPLTLVAAVNPFMLWYEHTLMAESVFLFCTLLVALAGTLYALRQSWGRFTFLCLALILEAGARPEGKLLFGFGLFLVLLLHLRARELPFSRARFRDSAWPRLLGLAVLTVTMHYITKTSQAGLLLYTSVARLTPDNLKIAPGFEPYIDPIRAELRRRWSDHPAFPKVRDRREVDDAATRYLKDHPAKGGASKHRSVNEFCLKLAMETCRRNLAELPGLAYNKFRAVSVESPAGMLDNNWLFDRQRGALVGASARDLRLSKGLTGSRMSTTEELSAFIDAHYGSVPWFNALSDGWLRVVNAWHFPDLPYRESGFLFRFPGVPFYFLVAGVGLVVMLVRPGELQLFHLAWGLALLAFFFTIMLTANVRPRFRFVFEPFWYFYLALLADSLLALVWRRPASVKPAQLPAT